LKSPHPLFTKEGENTPSFQDTPLKEGKEHPHPFPPPSEGEDEGGGENTPIPLLRRGGRQFPSKRGEFSLYP